mmetsp:Transcript_16080/g.40310  ORF Transcript_16080/g.40310 Transcript_16080/m.40310 type:complete len:917 (+) Transcript_16080:138-2888(+)|eukprot:CAMPEP_0116086380 /NCGR_PEP_ID=MMETSP0327-20121206/4824_1 /TAXON_ID=44447 /ORGANISM="Pseudo-nitzschia delicatissima, Strain B596" /LENGTH=916 /DNA_ID=CAMNT_0003577427 /DNA_START=131 /DNA_END=2881 /DNA_ORIENTATION=+
METREEKRGSQPGLPSKKNQVQNEKTLGKKRPRRSTSSSPKNQKEIEKIDDNSIDDAKVPRLSTTSLSDTTNSTNLQEIESHEKGPLPSTDIHNTPKNDATSSTVEAPVGVSLPWFERGGPCYKRPASLLWDAPRDANRIRKGERNRKGTIAGAEDVLSKKPAAKSFAGMKILSKKLGVCAECGMESDDVSEGSHSSNGNVVVLCDGPGCDRELHLKCCKPPLLNVPEGDFFCFDCHPNGGYGVTLLEQYLDETEAKRDAHNHELFCEEDLTQVSSCHEMDDVKTKIPHSAKVVLTPNRRERRISHGKKDGTPISDSNSNCLTSGKRKRKSISDSFTFVDKLIYQDMEEHQPDFLKQVMKGICAEGEGKGAPCSHLDVCHRNKHNDDTLLVGCAIRFYCPTINDNLTGRILQIREPPDNRDPNNVVSEDYDRNHDTECLVRFEAGREYRKKTITRWIRLEEHAVAVACPHFVWGKFETWDKEHYYPVWKKKSSASPTSSKERWVPVRLWMRSSKELTTILDKFDESLGQISYRDFRKFSSASTSCVDGDFRNNTALTSQNPRSTPQQRNGQIQTDRLVNGDSGKHDSKAVMPHNADKNSSYLQQEWVIGEGLGREVCKYLHIPTQTKDYCYEVSASPKTKKGKPSGKRSPRKTNALSTKPRENEMMLAVVQAEQEGRFRIRSWNKLPLQNPWHEKALTSLDESSLGPLTFDVSYDKTTAYKSTEDGSSGQEENGCEEKSKERTIAIEPSPLIRTGLDRMYILEQFVNQFNKTQERNGGSRDDRLKGTKDMAMSLSCELVSNHSITACIQQQNRIARMRQEQTMQYSQSQKLQSSRVSSPNPPEDLSNNQANESEEISESTRIKSEATETLKALPISQSPTSSTGIPLLVSNETKATGVSNGTRNEPRVETMVASST